MSKVIRWGLVAVVMMGGATLVTAGPASAGSAGWGGYTCTQGSLFTRASGNQTVYHEIRYNGTPYRKRFDNGATIKTNIYYSGLVTSSAASIQNGTGYLSGATRNCAD